jgi:hypothetical protein
MLKDRHRITMMARDVGPIRLSALHLTCDLAIAHFLSITRPNGFQPPSKAPMLLIPDTNRVPRFLPSGAVGYECCSETG